MKDIGLTFCAKDVTLLTDLYQFTTTACFVSEELEQRWASFELFTRHLPEGFGYLISMGLAQALDYLEKFCFNSAQLEALQATEILANVPESFWSLLSNASFSGDVWAVPEGTAVFANEPLLRVEAPLWQGFFVGTFLLNTLNYQTLVATRAARIREAAGSEIKLLEGGTRRAFSPQAALWAARAALASGFDSTSNVLAAFELGQKPSGSMAHAFVLANTSVPESEVQAFKVTNRYFPNATLVLDTYDTVIAAQELAELSRAGELKLQGVRLDSGDLVALSKKVRSLLPAGTCICASGDLDEHVISKLRADGACIDAYSVGTKLVTGLALNGVYKLVEIDGIPVMKASSGKVNYPGRKQIFRGFKNEQIQRDRLGLATEMPKLDEQPLMQLVFKQGQRLYSQESLETITKRTAASVLSLPTKTRRICQPIVIQPHISNKLQNLIERVKQAM